MFKYLELNKKHGWSVTFHYIFLYEGKSELVNFFCSTKVCFDMSKFLLKINTMDVKTRPHPIVLK